VQLIALFRAFGPLAPPPPGLIRRRRFLEADAGPLAVAVEGEAGFLESPAELQERAAIGIGAVLVASDGVGSDARFLAGLDDVPAKGGAGHALQHSDHGRTR